MPPQAHNFSSLGAGFLDCHQYVTRGTLVLGGVSSNSQNPEINFAVDADRDCEP
jgi:hypothetical protein